ncbi:MAG: 2-oxoacid:acceptor oxidoreductase family protein [Gemmatimonadaceae bacterium]|nr:2-oxoacid:acceptor oxidoreductase family protein [Gemmatimonadaceae bacterium]
MRELRLHGRGGQGTVIASKLLAVALFLEGREVQSFPMFGVERRGSPVTAFLRVADEPLKLRCEIQHPDELIVLDPSLIGSTDITAGLKPGGRILINTDQAPEDFPALLDRAHVSTIDATGIAVRHGLGGKAQPIVNTAILGAYAADTGLITEASMIDAIREEVPVQIDANIAAAREAMAAVRHASMREVARA